MAFEAANPRRSKKSKKGCQTCKIRHVKCDEIRPACTKCTSTGRKCDYLEEPQVPVVARSQGLSTEHSVNPIASRLAFSASVLSEAKFPKSPRSPWSSYDARSTLCFDYFREVCCGELQGYFSSRLWEFFFLQVAHAEPAIKSAMLALSAMHYSQFACRDSLSQSLWRQHAITHFVNAVRELNGQLDGNLYSHKLALIASLTFTYYELLSGEETTSLLHLRGGANILSSLHDKSRDSSKLQTLHTRGSGLSPLPPPDLTTPQPPALTQGPVSISLDTDLSELTSAFARAITEVSCYGVRYMFNPLTVPVLPASCASLSGPNGARYHLDLVVAYMYTTLDFRLESTRTLPTEPLTEPIASQKELISSLFHQWKTMFHNYQASSLLEPASSKDHTVSLILSLQSRLAYLKLVTHFFQDESIYDHYTDEFQELIEICEEVLNSSSASTNILTSTSTPAASDSTSISSPSSSSSPHSNSGSPYPTSNSQRTHVRFTTDSAIVHPLFFVTLKCRHPILRRRALVLLRRAGREAAHNGYKLSAAARWIVEKEESDSDSDSDSDTVLPGERQDNAALIDAIGQETEQRETLSVSAEVPASIVKREARIRTLALRFCPDGESVQVLCARREGGHGSGNWTYFGGLAWYDGDAERAMSGEQQEALGREMERYEGWHRSVR